MKMDYERASGTNGLALGYSWPDPTRTNKDLHVDPRIRVCPDCLRLSDDPDVKIIQLPPRVSDRPKCQRCNVRLGSALAI